MADFLARGEAPLSPEEWEQIDSLVVKVARQQLVGRRFIDIYGPLGPGVQVVPAFTIAAEEGAVRVAERPYLPVRLFSQDFLLSWQDIEHAHQYHVSLELGPVAVAACSCAQAEDEYVLGELLQKAGTKAALGDWTQAGAALNSVANGAAALAGKGFFGPYALVLHTSLYAKLHRVLPGTGELERELVEEIAKGGVFQTPFLPQDRALLVSQGPQNLDLAVAQDLITAYLGPEDMDHRFRVFETLVLRIKRPQALCVLS